MMPLILLVCMAFSDTKFPTWTWFIVWLMIFGVR